MVVRHLRLAESRAQRPPLTPFDERLLETRFPPGALARSLQRVRTAQQRIRRLLQEEEKRLARLHEVDQFGTLVRRTYGRLASFVREVDPDLELLRAVEKFRSDRPTVDPNVPTVAVAGFPNVGKSSLVARLSSAHPEVASYPFTTRSIVVGHTDLGFDRLQVMDTPGVLGRVARRNPAEREALAALRTGATVILFVLDPTETCGYPRADQEALLERWRIEFPSTTIIEVETKADLMRTGSGRLSVSPETGEGIEALRRRIGEALARRVSNPPSVSEPVPVRRG